MRVGDRLGRQRWQQGLGRESQSYPASVTGSAVYSPPQTFRHHLCCHHSGNPSLPCPWVPFRGWRTRSHRLGSWLLLSSPHHKVSVNQVSRYILQLQDSLRHSSLTFWEKTGKTLSPKLSTCTREVGLSVLSHAPWPSSEARYEDLNLYR